MISSSMTIKWGDYLTAPKREVAERIVKSMRKISNLLIKAMKLEIPVDQGMAKKQVGSKLSNGELVVSSGARSGKGYNYPAAVAGGTGKYKGSSKDFASGGRVRSGNSQFRTKSGKLMKREEIIGFFAGLRARGVEISIKPNKFAARALENSQNKIQDIISNTFN